MSIKIIVVKRLVLLVLLALTTSTSLAQDTCEPGYDYNYDVYTWMMLTRMDWENNAWAQVEPSADCVTLCEELHPGFLDFLSRLWCQFSCAQCEEMGVEPCTIPSSIPGQPPVLTCECGGECCPGDKKCCRMEESSFCCGYLEECCEEGCTPFLSKCCGDGSCPFLTECCDDEVCCTPLAKCCEGKCCEAGEICCPGSFSAECCPPDRCTLKGCCPDNEVVIDDLCCDSSEIICLQEAGGTLKTCCPPEKCIDGVCKKCPVEGQKPCVDKCCESGENCNIWTDVSGVEHSRCCPLSQDACRVECCPEHLFCCGKLTALNALCCSESACCIPEPPDPEVLPQASCFFACSCPSNQCPSE